LIKRFSITRTRSWSGFVYRNGIARHDVFDFPAALMHEIIGGTAGAEEELQPAGPLALGADFGTAQEIPLRDDADQFT
jgi:hypothetical protein